MKYFGTDGIRGVIGVDLNKRKIKKIAKGLVRFYSKYKLKKILLVGNDSRISSDYILSIFSSVILSCGIRIDNIGICSSPCLAFVAKKFNYPLAMMISASHNSSEYNGIKFFNTNGEKISEKTELILEKLIDTKNWKDEKNFSTQTNVEYLKNCYITYLKEMKHFDFPIIIDCANGGACDISKAVFTKSKFINSNYDGLNINLNSGCTNIEFLRTLCIKERKIGIALDGDADRITIVDENGSLITGDKILYILSKFYLKGSDKIVGTIYSNTGLEKSLKSRNIELIRANVGDKNVYEMMKKTKSTIGGENAGHIILRQYFNTGDGLLTGIVICNILNISKSSLRELLIDYKQYYQANDSIRLDGKFKLNEDLKLIINKYERSNVRIIIRPSGTEPILRILVECEQKEIADSILKKLKNYINSSIGIKN